MHAQYKACPLVDGVAIISQMRAIGSSHFANDGARACHDLGNSKSIADLDQFSARDNHLMPERQLFQNQIDGRGIVVDDNRRPAQEPFEQARRMRITAPRLPEIKSYSRLE